MIIRPTKYIKTANEKPKARVKSVLYSKIATECSPHLEVASRDHFRLGPFGYKIKTKSCCKCSTRGMLCLFPSLVLKFGMISGINLEAVRHKTQFASLYVNQKANQWVGTWGVLSFDLIFFVHWSYTDTTRIWDIEIRAPEGEAVAGSQKCDVDLGTSTAKILNYCDKLPFSITSKLMSKLYLSSCLR